jgi:methionine sulfoxide reductase heme-binding subunit
VIAAVTWYLTRGSGAVALILLTVALVLGIPVVRSANSTYAPRLVVQLLHRNASLLAIVFVALHVVTTVADSFVSIRLVDAVVPFAASYQPLWLGLGAIASDLLLAVTVTSLVRTRLSYRTWRGVHLSAYACWPLALLHGLGTGSDTGFTWMRVIDVACAAAVLVAVGWRLWAPPPATTPTAAPR